MSENRSLNSLFARLDESKANRANEANREHEKAAEEAEKERQKKKVEESAVEKYRVYDDDYEPEVMIPKGNPGAVQQPAKPKKEKKGTKAVSGIETVEKMVAVGIFRKVVTAMDHVL